MKIYSEEAMVPAVAITLATGNCNTQPILFTTQFGNTGTYDGCDDSNLPVELKWVVKSVEVTLTRDWGTSQSIIVLSCSLPDKVDILPPLPDVSSYRGGIYPYLSEEDEIRIYAGYVDSLLTPITADLLDEIPFNFEDIQTKTTFTQTDGKPLCPIFWGFIDKMEFSGNSKGLQLVISCRDRTRVFSDTKIISLQSFQGKQQATEATGNSAVDATNDLSSLANGDRVSIILELANAASGNPYGSGGRAKCWKGISKGLIVRGFTYSKEDPKKVVVEFPQENPAKWVRTACFRLMNDKAVPRMNVWAERPPIVKGEPTAVLQVLNKSPIEIIDYIAKTEERPMDFFASHINGDFILGPRVKDTLGFDDPLRMYRTYFFKTYPKEVGSPPSLNQMIISIRASRSTLFSFNKFVLIDSTVKSRGVSLIKAVRQGFSALPYYLKDREPSPPCKTQVIYDGGLASYDNPEAGALLLGLAHARVWSRDTQGVQLELVGDPTLHPGEAIRVYNTFLHDYQTYMTVDPDKDEEVYKEIKGQAKEVAEETSTQKQEDRIKGENEQINKWVSKYLSSNPAKVPSDIKNLILPYYSIRTVQHKITAQGNRGFYSVIQAVSDL